MIKPLGQRVILKEKDVTKTVSGIILPNKKETQYGEVLVTNDKAPVQEGDTVIYDITNFHEVDYKGDKFLIVHYDNLLAVEDID